MWEHDSRPYGRQTILALKSMCGGSEPDAGSSYRPVRGSGATPPAPDPVASIGAVYEGVAGLQAYREASAETCAIFVRDEPRSFCAQCRLYHLGSAVLADVRSSSLRYRRSTRHVALGAYDHYQITFTLSGQIQYRSGRRSAIVRPNDIIILDGARETDADVHAPDHQALAHVLTLFVPRTALAPLLRAPDGGHLLLLSRAQPLARSLHIRVAQILEAIELESRAQGQTAVQGLIGLLAGGLNLHQHRPPAARRAARRSTAESLKRLIERRLDSPALSVALLCSHSGCSRATVYRLLQADGGPIRYIRQRRLQRALQELISARVSHGRILELALRHRFASEATFSRAFRRTFGIPPGEMREIAARSRRAWLAGGAALLRRGTDGTEAINWIRALTDTGR